MLLTDVQSPVCVARGIHFYRLPVHHLVILQQETAAWCPTVRLTANGSIKFFHPSVGFVNIVQQSQTRKSPSAVLQSLHPRGYLLPTNVVYPASFVELNGVNPLRCHTRP